MPNFPKFLLIELIVYLFFLDFDLNFVRQIRLSVKKQILIDSIVLRPPGVHGFVIVLFLLFVFLLFQNNVFELMFTFGYKHFVEVREFAVKKAELRVFLVSDLSIFWNLDLFRLFWLFLLKVMLLKVAYFNRKRRYFGVFFNLKLENVENCTLSEFGKFILLNFFDAFLILRGVHDHETCFGVIFYCNHIILWWLNSVIANKFEKSILYFHYLTIIKALWYLLLLFNFFRNLFFLSLFHFKII